MKKYLLIPLIILVLVGSVSAERSSVASSSQTASALVFTGSGVLHGILFLTDGGTAVTALNVYDNTAESGTKLIPTDSVITTSAADRMQYLQFSPPVRFMKGIYVGLTCGGAVAYTVYYSTP